MQSLAQVLAPLQQPEGERIVEMIRGEPEMTASRIVSERRLPEELVSVDLIHEKRVSEKEVSHTESLICACGKF